YQHFVCCPFHDDEHPSLALWRHRDSDKFVCKCYSKQSNSPAAQPVYLDAFDIHCLREKLKPGEAVAQLAQTHNLGNPATSFVMSPMSPQTPPPPDVLTQHKQRVTAARQQLEDAIKQAAADQGKVTIIHATMGLGKTHAAAHQALILHSGLLKVAIC